MLTINQSIKGCKVDFFLIRMIYWTYQSWYIFDQHKRKKLQRTFQWSCPLHFSSNWINSLPQLIMLWLFFTDKWRKIGVWSAVDYQGYMYGLSGKVWNETSLQMADYDMLNVDYWCLMSRDRAGLRQCRHLRFLISFGDKIRPLAIFLATTFYLSKITSYCCQSTAQVRNIVC